MALAALAALNLGSFPALYEAWSRPEYSHGWLILPISAFLFLRIHHSLPPAQQPSSAWPGLIVLALGTAVLMLGNLALIPYLSLYGFVLAVGGLILTAAGWRRGLRYWPAWAFLLFLLPLPNALYWPLSLKLQFLSSQIGVMGIRAMSIPVFLDGNIIDLGTYQLQVAEACSGLRYLFPLMSFGFLFAALYQGPWWHRLLIFFSTIPITIAMNSFRISIIGFLVDRYGIGQAEGFLHFFEGWVIFIVCIALLYLLAWVLQRFSAKPRPVLEMLDIDTRGFVSGARSLASAPVSRAMMPAAIVIALAAGLWHFAFQRAEVVVSREPLTTFPMQIGPWSGTETRLDPSIENVLNARDYVLADYVDGPDKSQSVNFLVAYYASQNAGKSAHSPEVCIPGSGWEIVKWGPEDIPIEGAPDGMLHINRAIVQKGFNKQLVYYWFEQQGRKVAGEYESKAYLIYDSLMRGRSDGALIRYVTTVGPDGLDAADARIRTFISGTLPVIPRFVPP
ncbi:VPLPA-CTERM-specific exosortase XrtD [Aestuariivirga sp.]|uniref:VPLPA-CTERM-specific exosortase XrtD n=1 Tax=Aestuariivirga sp. TaxID=2650926 RepID=UPI0039E2CAA2